MFSIIRKYIFNSQFDSETEELYEVIVSLSRNSSLYKRGGVPDSLDGRYELIVLHTHLVIKKLIVNGKQGKNVSQKLFNTMVKDFDNSLRELGVGDLSVGKKVKKMIEGFYGRVEAYEKEFSSKTQAFRVLKRNLYGTTSPSINQIEYMWKYILRLNQYLDKVSYSEISTELSKFIKNKYY